MMEISGAGKHVNLSNMIEKKAFWSGTGGGFRVCAVWCFALPSHSPQQSTGNFGGLWVLKKIERPHGRIAWAGSARCPFIPEIVQAIQNHL
jgi:hypothetical protein